MSHHVDNDHKELRSLMKKWPNPEFCKDWEIGSEHVTLEEGGRETGRPDESASQFFLMKLGQFTEESGCYEPLCCRTECKSYYMT
jgi:hypothetical protein